MKKSISLFLVVMIILSSFATVNAEVELNRAWICDCGGHVTLRSTDTGKWRNIGLGECPHGNIDHRPYIQERIIIKHYACDNCSIEEDIVRFETREICQ